MLNTLITSSQALNTGETIKFDSNPVLTGCTATHSVGTDVINLNKPGFYFVSFNGVVTTTETEPVEITLYKDSAPVPGAISSANNSSGDIPYFSLSFSTIIQVKPSCCKKNTKLTFRNTGVAAMYDNANLVITKLC